jgi:hypothetical protein
MAKHFEVTITGTTLAVERKQGAIGEEARLDGIYVIRTPLPAAELGAAETVTAYKNLKYMERDFRHIKSDDLDLRPVFHQKPPAGPARKRRPAAVSASSGPATSV